MAIWDFKARHGHQVICYVLPGHVIKSGLSRAWHLIVFHIPWMGWVRVILDWHCPINWLSCRRRQIETFPRYWPFVRGIHRSPVDSPHKGQWRGALMFSLICVLTNSLPNNRGAGDLRRYRAHYDVTVMCDQNKLTHITMNLSACDAVDAFIGERHGVANHNWTVCWTDCCGWGKRQLHTNSPSPGESTMTGGIPHKFACTIAS